MSTSRRRRRLNQVERWFAELTRKQLQRGVHRTTRQLEADIRAFIDSHNQDPKPFKWTKSADDRRPSQAFHMSDCTMIPRQAFRTPSPTGPKVSARSTVSAV